LHPSPTSQLFPYTTLFRSIFEKSEGRVRDEEGLEPSVGILAGDPPPDLVSIEENKHKFLVDITRGQKTGFFLDQRDNRVLLSTRSEEHTSELQSRFDLVCR